MTIDQFLKPLLDVVVGDGVSVGVGVTSRSLARLEVIEGVLGCVDGKLGKQLRS